MLNLFRVGQDGDVENRAFLEAVCETGVSPYICRVMQYFHLGFDLPLERRDIASFRAAVARAAGFENDLLHNHRPDGSVHYRYPLVQYRSERGMAGIVGLNQGAVAIHDWLSGNDGYLLWNDERHRLLVNRIDADNYDISYHPEPHQYRLRQWLALNQRHYRAWSDIPDLASRAAALDRILVAHILTFCRAVDWRLPQRLDARVGAIETTYRTRLMGVDMVAFDLTFWCNLRLPPFIGLGKGVSHGFGVCRPYYGVADQP